MEGHICGSREWEEGLGVFRDGGEIRKGFTIGNVNEDDIQYFFLKKE